MIYPSRLNITRKVSLLLTYSATMLFGCNAPHMTRMTSDEWSCQSQSHQDASHGGATILDSVRSELSNTPAVPADVLVVDDISLFPSELASVARKTIGIGSVGQLKDQLTTPMTPTAKPVYNESSAKPEESTLRPSVSDYVSPLSPTLHRSTRYLSCGQASMLGAGAFALGSCMTQMLFSTQDTMGLEEISLLYDSCLLKLESAQNIPAPAFLWGYLAAEHVDMAMVGSSAVSLVSVGVLVWKKWDYAAKLENERRGRLKAEGRAQAASQAASIMSENSRNGRKG